MSPMSTTLDWILACERQGLLTSADVRRFRQLSEITGNDFSARVVLKWLSTRDRITAEQADRILSGPPDLSPVELIIRVLGDAEDHSGAMDLESPSRDLDDIEEDTKDLDPLDRDAVGDVVLPPRGSPAFAGTVAVSKAAAASPSPATIAAEESPLASEVPSREKRLSVLDELLADAGPENVQRPHLKSRTDESLSQVIASPGVWLAAAVVVLVAIAAVVALWIASH